MNPDYSLRVRTRNRGTLKSTTVSTSEWWELGGQASSDREHMSEIGRKGGEHAHGGPSTQEHQSERGVSDRSDTDREVGDKTRGGSSEQHAEAGRQSHKNS